MNDEGVSLSGWPLLLYPPRTPVQHFSARWRPHGGRVPGRRPQIRALEGQGKGAARPSTVPERADRRSAVDTNQGNERAITGIGLSAPQPYRGPS